MVAVMQLKPDCIGDCNPGKNIKDLKMKNEQGCMFEPSTV